uniref:Uncharacterized protein n=1 Tax=Mantoniella antarctica TaxID=81844 RepID=A0A7S0T254_9CHLO|mmetsp:Transcript_8852/g.21784  ORF Transcript_8852/g.21784 Transcript_8852/m.21784 type:complete len:139 (+) Transcript_8852:185-601(+)
MEALTVTAAARGPVSSSSAARKSPANTTASATTSSSFRGAVVKKGVTLKRGTRTTTVRVVAKATTSTPRDDFGSIVFSATSTPKGSLPAGRTRDGRAITADDEAAEVLTVSLASVVFLSTLGLLVLLASMFVSSSLVR